MRYDDLGTPMMNGLPLRTEPPGWCCPFCGRPIGYLGRVMADLFGTGLHGCDNRNVMHPQEYWRKRELALHSTTLAQSQ